MMKNRLCFVLILMFVIVFTSSFAFDINYDGYTIEYAGPDITLIIGENVFVPMEGQMPPIIIDSRTLVPVREVFELLDGVVTWNAEEQKVGVSIDDKSVELTINDSLAIVNGEEKYLDVPAKIINNKTMVPVRFISENCGLLVEWNGETSTVTITKAVENTPDEPVIEETIVPETTIPEEPVVVTNSLALQAFNGKFERFFGNRKSKTAVYQLCDLVTINNASMNGQPISIELIKSEDNSIKASDIATIHEITTYILKANNVYFDVSGSYDDFGYINELCIKQLGK